MGDKRGSFRRGSRCDAGQCVEVGDDRQEVRIRDSGAPDVVLQVPRDDFAEFLDAVKRGEFDSAQ